MKDIPKFNGLYSATEDGKIYSHRNSKFLIPYKTNYLYVSLCGKKYSVHRLVAETFIPNPNFFPVVDHIDDNPFNNNVDNLQWVTTKINVTKSYSKMGPVRNFCNCKLFYEENLIGTFESINECCRFCETLGLSYSSMNKYRKCRGYVIKV